MWLQYSDLWIDGFSPRTEKNSSWCLQYKFKENTSRCDARRWKTLDVPVVKGGQNLPPWLEIGLTDLQNIGRRGSGPPGPPIPASLLHTFKNTKNPTFFDKCCRLKFTVQLVASRKPLYLMKPIFDISVSFFRHMRWNVAGFWVEIRRYHHQENWDSSEDGHFNCVTCV